jgi:CheY-like chemotaxis protein
MLSETRMKQRILVVDDEPQIREMLSLYFSNHGYETVTAGDSTQALRAVEASKVDVVVLDIGLAEEDGLKLLEQLKTQYPDLHVIMLTGMGFVEDLLQEAQQKGADGYVSKVLPLDELLTAIQRILKTATA